MSNIISKSQFKSRALEIFREVEASGEPVIITDHGKPRLEIRCYRPVPSSALETLRGSVLRFDRPTDPVGEEDWDAAS